MSVSRTFQVWQSIEATLRRLPFKEAGHRLSRDDSARFAHALVLWALCLQDLALQDEYLVEKGMSRSFSKAGLTTWLDRLSNYDIDHIVDQLKLCLAELRESHEEFCPYMGAMSRRHLHKRMALMGTPIDTQCLGPVWTLVCLYKRTQRPSHYRMANTACQFIVRLTLKELDWLEEQAVQDYLDFESELKQQRYDDKLLADMNRIVRGMLSDMDVSDIHPRHSNGATAHTKRGEGLESKMRNMSAPSWSVRQLAQMLEDYPIITDNGLVSSLETSPVDESRYSVFAQVPKSLNKKRGISMENEESQYYQNAIFDAFDRHFSRHPEIAVNLHRQDLSRDLCQYGMASDPRIVYHRKGSDDYTLLLRSWINCDDGYDVDYDDGMSYGTIDLSSASDSVTWSLVKAVFRGTKILPLMGRARTRMVHYRGRRAKGKCSSIQPFTIAVEKFAPMGSSMCFPVESLIFSAAAALAVERSGRLSKRRVYGDDCIVHRSAVQEFIKILEDLHFKVNVDKSYMPGSPFLEACGMEALRGFDVTPTRIPRRYDYVGLCLQSPTSFEGAVEFIHTLREADLTTASAYVENTLNAAFGVPYRSSYETESVHEFSTIPAKIRYNSKLQRYEELIMTTRSQAHRGNDDIRYYECLRRYSLTKRETLLFPEDRIDVRVGAASNVAWRATWSECADQELAENYCRNGLRTKDSAFLGFHSVLHRKRKYFRFSLKPHLASWLYKPHRRPDNSQ